ncbi:MAG: hypothetical protein KC643_32130 [Nitrospira sp.]|nr:hypothetical protein [Nitrospira sp.]MDR4488995.1 hypothetical protein [Nitrospirales bacterium]
MITEYELYSDEREHKNAGGKHLVLGGVVCTDKGCERICDALSKVRADFSLSHEMRWAKVSNAYLDAYKVWMDVFFNDPYARFSLHNTNLSGPKWKAFRPNQRSRPSRDDKLSSAFYQFLLVTFGPLRDTKRWWVYPDAGFFSRDDVLQRVEFLFNRTYKKAFGPKTSRIIRFARSRDSKSQDIIQLADLLLGASACNTLGPIPSSEAKRSLVEHWQQRLEKIPKTTKGIDRFSQYLWVPPDEFSYRR